MDWVTSVPNFNQSPRNEQSNHKILHWVETVRYDTGGPPTVPNYRAKYFFFIRIRKGKDPLSVQIWNANHLQIEPDPKPIYGVYGVYMARDAP